MFEKYYGYRKGGEGDECDDAGCPTKADLVDKLVEAGRPLATSKRVMRSREDVVLTQLGI